MSEFYKQGIQRIKDTKKYARKKNVTSWLPDVITATILVFFLSDILTFYSMVSMLAIENPIFLAIGPYLIPILPFVLTFLFMMKFGQIPIKLMILKTFYLQRGFMKLINRSDMYLWRKTGKDCVAANFLVKHRRITQLIFLIPGIIYVIFFW